MTVILGTIILWIIALALLTSYPLTEFARGMASNPDQHPVSKGGCLLSVVGLVLAVMLLSGCSTTKQIPVEVIKTVEVKVPVAVPCVRNRPAEVEALRNSMPRKEWEKLSTDQREKLLAAQALERKAHGDKLSVATAGCR